MSFPQIYLIDRITITGTTNTWPFLSCYSEHPEMALWAAESSPLPASTPPFCHSQGSLNGQMVSIILPLLGCTHSWNWFRPFILCYCSSFSALPQQKNTFKEGSTPTILTALIACSSELAVALSSCMFFIMWYFKYNWLIQFTIAFPSFMLFFLRQVS